MQMEFNVKTQRRGCGAVAAIKLLPGALLAVMLAFAGRAQTVDSLKTEPIEPWGIAVDRTNNIYYVTESVQNRILRIVPSTLTNNFTTIAPGQFYNPEGIIQARGGLVVSDSGNQVIKFVSLGGSVSNIAGLANNSGFADGQGTAARFRSPAGLAIDASGNIYVADTQNNAVRKITPSNVVSTVVTNLYRPQGVAVDEKGRLFIADTGNQVIRMLDTNGSLSTIGGLEGHRGFTDVSGEFNDPIGLLWVGGLTGLVVADKNNASIRNISQNAETRLWEVGTLAGKGTNDHAQVDGPLDVATFDGPNGLGFDRDNLIVITDLRGGSIRRFRRTAAVVTQFIPDGGFFTNNVTVILSNSSPNVVFNYTLDGTDPTPYSPTNTTGQLLLTGGYGGTPDVSLHVRAYAPDFAASEITGRGFHFEVEELGITPGGGSFFNDIDLSISTLTSNAVITYTTDKTAPTPTGPVWTDRTLGSNVTIVARGFRDGFTPTFVRSNVYKFFVSSLDVSPSGIFTNNPVQVTITNATTNTLIYWTIDGSVPVATNPKAALYTGPFMLATNGLLRSAGYKNGYTPTEAFSESFFLQVSRPTVTPDGVFTNNPVEIRMDCATAGAKIYWSVDGSEPGPTNANSFLYTNKFILSDQGTGEMRTKAYRDGFTPSSENSSLFELRCAQPVILPDGASSRNPVPVQITSLTTNALIYWTIDGSQPSRTNGVLYTGPFTLRTNGTMRAIAVRNGFTDSFVETSFFDLNVGEPLI